MKTLMLLFAMNAFAEPLYLDGKLIKEPRKRKCNRIEYYSRCSEVSHYRDKDYLVFHWIDQATMCKEVLKKDGLNCTYLNQWQMAAVREGCEINWCKEKK